MIFAFVMSVTPGPANVMLLASGVNYGFQRSIPHMPGITIGFSFMILVVGLGVGQVFERFPVTHEIMRRPRGVSMLWLAGTIANSGLAGAGKASGSPLTFFAGGTFPVDEPQGLGHHDQRPCDLYAGRRQPVTGAHRGAGLRRGEFSDDGHVDHVRNAAAEHACGAAFPRVFNISMALLLVLSLAPLGWRQTWEGEGAAYVRSSIPSPSTR